MAYKRFVKRDGKTFGPYYYESYRDGNHIRKRYIGRLDDNKKFVAGSGTTFGDKDLLSFLFLGILILGFILFSALFYTTGKTVLGVSEISANDTSLFGQIGFNLRQGELIPGDAVVRVQLNNQERLVPISMLLQGQEQNGKFYVEDNVIEGSGEGYGIIGTKKFYPNVHYKLELETFEASKQPIYSINEESSPQENATETTPAEQPIEQTPTEEPAIEPPAEQAVPESQEIPAVESAEPAPTAEPGITGQAATTDFIDGTVNASEEVVYIVAENQQISLVSGSVRNDSDTLADSTIDLDINDKNASVTTNYYTEEHGFGPEFLTNERVNFAINLSNFGIAPENGVLRIQIVYQNIVLAETDNIIQLEQPQQAELPAENVTQPELPAGNETNVTEQNVTAAVNIITSHEQIRLNSRVKWMTNVTMEIPQPVIVELPAEAENITVTNIAELIEQVEPVEQVKKGNLVGLAGEIITKITVGESGKKEVVLDENATAYAIEYYTSAPESFEQDTSYGKRVVISGPENLGYTNILSFASIPEKFSAGQENMIKIRWVENNSYVPFDAYDLDGNGNLDYVEWTTEHLSNQTFDIILITKAEHLDENRTLIEDVYDYVKERDGIFKEIPDAHYLRVTFAKKLTSENDITIYAKSNSSASIEVYEKNKSEVVTIFNNVQEEKRYKVLLTNLTASQDTFDLKVVNNAVDFDYVVDPTVTCGQTISASTNVDNDLNCNGTAIIIDTANVIFDCQGHTFTGNTSGHGIEVDTLNNLTIKNCKINKFNNGVYLIGSNNTITNNTFTNNTKGVSIGPTAAASKYNNISYNTFTNNSIGVSLVSAYNGVDSMFIASIFNSVYNNKFNNTINAFDNCRIGPIPGTVCPNYWNITKTAGTNIVGGSFLGGNWWHDYSGTDSDSDGIGNTKLPYNSSNNISQGGDYLPLMYITAGVANCGDTITQDTNLTQDLQCNGTAITIGTSNITLDCQGHKLTGNGSGYGINISGFENNTVKNCIINSFKYGVFSSYSPSCSFGFNTLYNNSIGFEVTVSSAGRYYGNILTNNTDKGFDLTTSQTSWFNNNTVVNSGTAFRVYISTSNFTYNTVYNCTNGIAISQSANSFVLFNNITNNTGLGISISETSGVNITSNIVEGNTYGIGLSTFSDSNKVISNKIQNNTWGLNIESQSQSNVIYNNFFNNTINVYATKAQVWNTTKTSGTNIIGGSWLGGNYWSDYNGTDSDDDGIGNTLLPYNASSNITQGGTGDWLPLLYPITCDYYLDSCKNSGWESKKNYCLNASISTKVNCMNITNNSVTLNCQGYMINSSNATALGIFNTGGYDNITIKNCNVSGFRYGIYFYSTLASLLSTGNLILNTTLYNNFDNGIYTSYFNNSIIENCTFDSNSSTPSTQDYGIYLIDSSNNTIRGNTFLQHLTTSLENYRSTDNKIINNTFFDEELRIEVSSYRVLVENNTFNTTCDAIAAICVAGTYCNNLTIRNNYVSNNDSSGTSCSGVNIQYAHNSFVLNNTINRIGNAQTDYGIYVYYSHNATVTSNAMSGVGGNGIYFLNSNKGAIENNTLLNGSLTSTTTPAIAISTAMNNKVRSNFINKSTWGVFIDNSQNTTFESNQINNTVYGFVLAADAAAEFNISADTGNTVDGKYIYYLTKAQNQTYDASSLNMALFGCYECNNITLTNLNSFNNSHGIILQNTYNSSFKNISISSVVYSGIYQFNGTGNSFSNIRMTNNSGQGTGVILANNARLTLNDGYIANFSYGVIEQTGASGSSFVNVTFFDIDTYGIYLAPSSNNSIENCTFNSSSSTSPYQDTGVYSGAANSNNNTIRGCTFGALTTYGVYVYGDDNNIINNTFSSKGIYIYSGSDRLLIENNTINNSGPSIIFACATGANRCFNATIKKNYITSSNDRGISMTYAVGLVIINNTINKTGTAAGDDGMYLATSNNNTITYNQITDAGANGIYCFSGINNTAYSNTIKTSIDAGFRGAAGCANSTIYNNYFKNKVNAVDLGRNLWNITKTAGTNIIGGSWLGGNYWTGAFGYNGTDNDGDGIGNTNLPWKSWGNNITNGGDYLPLVRIINCSSAIDDDTTLTSDLNCNGTALTISENSIVLDCNGHTLTGNGSGYGIYLGDSANVIVKNCNIKSFQTGIGIGTGGWVSTNATIINNTIDNMTSTGVSSTSAYNNNISGNTISNVNYGVYLSWSLNSNVFSNTIENCTDNGIEAGSDGNSGTNITGNTITNASNGMHLSFDTFIVKNNIINRSRTSGLLSDENVLKFYNNTIQNSGVNGIYLGSPSAQEFINNTITSSGIGINVSTRNTLSNDIFLITGNTITSNYYGFYAINSSNSTIYNNYFNNTINAYDNGVNYWNTTKTAGTNIINGSFFGGNYWSDYAGTDDSGDGIGDTLLPYNASNSIANGGDWLPLIYPIIVTATNISSCRLLNESNMLYTLNVSVNTTTTCFNVTATNVTLDCINWSNIINYGNQSSVTKYYGVYSNQATTTIKNCAIRRGNLATATNDRYAIYFNGVSNGSISNVNATINRYGMNISGSGNLINNSIASNNTVYGIILASSTGSTINNVTAGLNNDKGILLINSNGNVLTGNNASNNINHGIFLASSSNNTLDSNTLQENGAFDFYITANSNDQCNNSIQNTIGSGGRSILYYNTSAILSNNNTISELILCNADYSRVDNVTVSGSDSKYNNGVLILRTDYTNITNTNSSSNQIGFNVALGNYNTLAGNTANNNSIYGFYLENGTYSVLNNSVANNNTYGIYLYNTNHSILTNNNVSGNTDGLSVYYGVNNSILNNIANRNKDNAIYLYYADSNNISFNIANGTTGGGTDDYGIFLDSSANFNIIYGNNITSNTDAGIYFYSATAIQDYNNTIESNIIKGNGNRGIWFGGVSLVSGFYNNIINNIIDSNTGAGIYSSSYQGTNITLNIISNNTEGIRLLQAGSANSIVTYNTVSNNTNDGILLTTGIDNCTIHSNIIDNNEGNGIFVSATGSDVSQNIKIYNNTATNNAYGLAVNNDMENSEVVNNTFQENTLLDIFITAKNDNSCNNTIINNLGSGGRSILYYNTTAAVLNNNDTISELILCNADNSVIENVTIQGSDTLRNNGILLVMLNNTRLTNVSSLSNYYGFYIDSSSGNNITGGVINGSGSDAIYITAVSSGNNIFNNVTITNTNASKYDINFATSGIQKTQLIDMAIGNYTFTSLGNTTFKDTGEGEIKFLPAAAITATGNNLSADISIKNNSVTVNSAGETGLNKTANITLYNLRTDFVNPIILRNDLTCPSNICYNYTNLSAGTVVFNVTSWTNYSVGEFYTSLNISGCQLLSEANKIYQLTQPVVSTVTCFNVTASNVTLDCLGWTNRIVYGNQSSTTFYYGVFSNQNFTTVRNCEITRGNASLITQPRYGITFLVSNNGTILNSNISRNRIGIYFNATLNSTIFNNTFTNNSAFGIYLNRSTTNNTIYNNFFNNSGAINAYANGSNNWNVTYDCTGAQNIIGGSCIGGNWWNDYAGLDDGSGTYPYNNSNDGIGDTLLPYNASNNITVPGTGDWLPLMYLIPTAVTLNSPLANLTTDTNMLVFNCSVTGFADLVNISLLTNTSGTWQIDATKPAIGPSATVVFVIDRIPVGTYDWNCIAAGASGTVTADSNRNFTINQTAKAMVTKINSTGTYYRIWDNGTWKSEVKTSATLNELSMSRFYGSNYGGAAAYITGDKNHYGKALAGNCAFNKTNWTCGGNYISSQQVFNSWGYGISSGSYLFNGSSWMTPFSGEGFPRMIEGIDSYGKKVAILYQKGDYYNPSLTLKIWNGYDFAYASTLDYEYTIQYPNVGEYYRGVAGDLIFDNQGKLIIAYGDTNNVTVKTVNLGTSDITTTLTHIPVGETETVDKIQLAGNGTYTILGSNGDKFYMEIWNGSEWSDFNLLDANSGFNITYYGSYSSNYNVFDIAFNQNKALIAWVDNVTGNNVVKYRFWDGALQAEQTLAVSDKPKIVQVAGNPNGNEFILTTILNDSNTSYFVYDGSSWDAGVSSGKVSFISGESKNNVYANLPVSFINNLDTNLEPAIKLNTPDFKTIFEKGVDTNITFNCEVWDDAGIENISIYSDIYIPHGWGLVYNMSVNGAKYYNLSYTADITLVGGGPYEWNCRATDIGNKVSEAGVNKTFSISPQVVNLSDCYLGPNYGDSPGLPNESYVVVGVEVDEDWYSKTPSWVHVCKLLDNTVNISQGRQAFSYWGVSKPHPTQALVGVDEVHWETNAPWDFGWASKWAQSAKITNGIINLRNCYTGGSNYGYTSNFNQVKPYFVVIGSDLGDTHPIVSRRATWVQVCELATYELISVFLTEPDDGIMTMDDNVLFNCTAASSVNNLSNLSIYIRELGNPLVATAIATPGEKELSVDYDYIGLPPGTYHWNCEAVDEQNRKAWAPKDYSLKKACMIPSDNIRINESVILCNGTYHVTDANKDGILIVNGADGITIKAMNTTVISDNGGTFLNITYSDGVELNGTSITSSNYNLVLQNFEQAVKMVNAPNAYIHNLNVTIINIGADDVIYAENSPGVVIDSVNILADTPDYGLGTMVNLGDGAGIKNSNITLSTQTAGGYTTVTGGNSYIIGTSVTGTGWGGYDPWIPGKGVLGFNVISDNNITGFDYCIQGGDRFYHNATDFYDGTIDNNDVTDCHYGITPGTFADIDNNTISDNYIALWLFSGNNSVTGNTFRRNTFDVLMNEPSTETDYYATGNNLSNGLGFNYTSDLDNAVVGDGLGMFGCVNCHNLTVQNMNSANTSFAAYIEGDNIRFYNINGTGLLNGLWVKGATDVTIENVSLVNGTNIYQPPLELGPYNNPYASPNAYGIAIYLYNSDKNAASTFNIKNLLMHGVPGIGFYYGLVVFGGTSLSNDLYSATLNVKNSTFVTNGINSNAATNDISESNVTSTGITIEKGTGTINNNIFNASSISVGGSGTIDNNTFYASSAGLSGGGTIDNNTFYGTGSSVGLGSTLTIFKNNIINALGGSFTIAATVGKTNEIFNNLFNASVIVSYGGAGSDVNEWNASLDCGAGPNIVGGSCMGGNYWKYYTGVDLTGDGIGDTLLPFTSTYIRSGNGDLLPLVINKGCGSTVFNNTVLDEDMNCSNTAVIIANNSVTFDCDGHSISGIGVGNGVEVEGYNNTIVKNCRISNFSVGIEFIANTNNTALNNSINLSTYGIYIYDSTYDFVLNNTANINQYGIYVTVADNNILTGNTADNNVNDGIDVDYSIGVLVANNTANWNANGFYIWHSNYSIIVNNSLSSNTLGMDIKSSFYNNVTSNTFVNNTDYGILFETGAENNSIYNNFFNNTANAFDDGTNYWNVTYDCTGTKNIISGSCTGGNFWSDYAGLDDGSGTYPNNNSNDGVGDTLLPYNSTSGVVNGGDWLPLMYYYNDTTPPNITLISPANNTLNTTSNTIIFNYNVTDASGIANCSLIINDAVNLTNGSIINASTNNFTQTLANGAYNWSINCTDNSTNYNIGASDVYNLSINVNLIPPNFSSPSNVSDTFQRWHNFTANITIRGSGGSELDAYIFATNASGAWLNKTVDISGTEYNASEPANITLGRGNSVCWYYWANDTFANSNQSSNYCFIVNDTAPTHSNPWIGAHNRLTSGLAGEWRFENSNTTWTYDETGMNNGTVTGATLSDKGRVGRGFEFDGVSANIQISNNSVLNFGNNSFSYFAWINTPNTGGTATYSRIFARNVYASEFAVQGTRGNLSFYQGGGAWKISTLQVENNTWTHVGLVWNGTNYMVYKNGVGLVVSSANYPAVTGYLLIGKAYTGAGFFNGTIDELMVFNRSLSADEIADVYNTSSGKFAYDSQDIGASANETTDADNDVLTNIYNWYQNNVSVALLNMPFDVEYSVAKDYTGSNNGTMSAYTTSCPDNYCAWTTGKIGDALSFDGVSNRVSLPNTAFNSSNDFAISLWYNAIGNRNGRLMAKQQNGIWAGSGFVIQYGIFHIGNGTGSMDVEFPAGCKTSGFTDYCRPGYQHLVVTKLGNNISLYHNGTIINSLNVSILGNNLNYVSGFNLGGYTNSYYNGTADEVMIFNRSLSASEITNIYTNQSAGKQDANMNRTGLVLDINLNETTGTKAVDSTGINNGTLSGYTRPQYNSTAGKYGGAYSFDGVDDYINIGVVTTGPNFTYTTWIKPNSGTTWQYIMGGGFLQPTFGLYLDRTIFLRRAGSTVQYSTLKYNVSLWNFVAVSYVNATSVTFFINGLNETQTDTLQLPGGTTNWIGKEYNNVRWLNSSIDEVMIFNRSLSASEIKGIYDSGYRNILKSETNLNDLWQVCVTPADSWLEGPTKCSWNMSIKTVESPIAYNPLAGNASVFERQPVFEWFNSTGIEPITYNILVANDSGFANGNLLINGMDIVQGSGVHSQSWDNLTSYTNNTATLPYDTILYWKVRAKNGDGASAWSETRNFTIQSVVSISFIVDAINFGNLTIGQSNDTTGNSPYPFVIQNDGNVKINGTGTSTYLWSTLPEPSQYYQYKMRINQTGAFNDTLSTMNFKNASYINTNTDLAYLLYQMNQNAVFMDIGVTAPSDEPAGAKSAVFTMTVMIAE